MCAHEYIQNFQKWLNYGKAGCKRKEWWFKTR